MEIGVLIITAILVTIVILPFIAMARGSRKKQNDLYTHLESFAVPHKGHVTEYDTLNNFAIGMDSQTKHVYFYKKTPKAEIHQDIDLGKIRSCSVEKKMHSTRNGKNTSEVLDGIRLAFSPAGGALPEFFELFDADENFQVSGELDIADKWRNKIQAALVA